MKNSMFFGLFLLVSVSCSENIQANLVVGTTGQIGDALGILLQGTDVELKTLMGPDADPHSYQAKVSDISAINQATLVFYNGFYLEAKMASLLEQLGDRSVALAEILSEERLIPWEEEEAAYFDPHVWNDMDLWWAAITHAAQVLSRAFPLEEEKIQSNLRIYQQLFQEHRERAIRRIQAIPENRKVLVTSHDAFQYFSRFFGLESYGLQGISTEEEASIQDRRELSRFIAENRIPVIFPESSVNPRSLLALQESVRALGWEVQVAQEELLSDALGDKEVNNTYLGMMEWNTKILERYLAQ